MVRNRGEITGTDRQRNKKCMAHSVEEEGSDEKPWVQLQPRQEATSH